MRTYALFYGAAIHSEPLKKGQLVVLEDVLNGTTRSFEFPAGFKVTRGERLRIRYWEPRKCFERGSVMEITDRHGFPLWDASTAPEHV